MQKLHSVNQAFVSYFRPILMHQFVYAKIIFFVGNAVQLFDNSTAEKASELSTARGKAGCQTRWKGRWTRAT